MVYNFYADSSIFNNKSMAVYFDKEGVDSNKIMYNEKILKNICHSKISNTIIVSTVCSDFDVGILDINLSHYLALPQSLIENLI